MLSFEEEEPSTEMLHMPATMDTTDATMENLLAQTTNLTVLDDDAGKLTWLERLKVWGIAEKDWGVEIKHTIKEASFLVFSFKSSQDLDRILTKNPLLLNNGLLIVERMTEIPLNWDKVLTNFPLSGRILHIPTSSITQGNLNRLAGFAGDIIEVQKADLTKIVAKVFFTFKVWCDINTPICSGFYSRAKVKEFGSRTDMELGMRGQSIAVKSSSMARPEYIHTKMTNPITNPKIQGLKTVDKGKVIAMTDPVG
ncbi:hypothetical protein G4B88_009427 [Cannabis sativa]|uniref:DUF4283 domain-containing protein n=1 Tax=Cannabis sativa TaxID=3483 RepID=A0A7J6GH23_CANSA|nr:hypothetical protein G4B88_009427 [Cannabis sativa]